MAEDITLIENASELAPNDLVKSLADLFRQGRLAQEYAMYTFWEMMRDGRYAKVVSTETGKNCQTQDEFVLHVRQLIGVSRQTMYTRNKIYDILTYLGRDKSEIITSVAESPYVYQRTLSSLVEWDTKRGQPVSFNLPDGFANEEDAKKKVSDILDAQEVMPTASDKLAYLYEDQLGRPVAKMYWDDDLVILEYTRQSIDPSGKPYTSESKKVTFIPNGIVPDDIKDQIRFTTIK